MSSSLSSIPGQRNSGPGILAKIKTGFKLSKNSLGVVREHPKLLVFPLLGALATLGFWIVFLVPLWIAGLFGSGAELVVLFLLYFLTTFAATFFTASLVFAVNQTFHNEEPRLGESMRAAWRRKGPILVWSAAAATVSLLLKKLEETNNPIAGVLSTLFAIGWTVLTFFIVPVIVFEDVSARSMFTRSGQTFRETWGESIGAGFGIAIIQFLIAIVGVGIAVLLALLIAAVAPLAGIVVGIFLVAGALVCTYLIGQMIWAVTKTALYVYAAEELVPEQFANFDFETLDGRAEQTASPGRIDAPPRHLD